MANQQRARSKRHSHAAPHPGMPVNALAAALGIALLATLAAGGVALQGAAAVAATPPAPADALAYQTARQDSAPASAAAPATTETPATAPPTDAAAAAADTPPGDPTASAPGTATAAVAPAAAPPAPPAVAATSQPATGASALSGGAPVLEREHKVSPGETLSTIAQRYGLTTETLVVNNAGVTDRDMLQVGQTLRVPPRDGLLYELRLGDSIQSVARRFGVDPTAILQEPANRLTAPDMVHEGQVVLVPGARTVPPSAAATSPTAVMAQSAARAATATARATAQATPATVAARPTWSGGFAWPITGPISSYFGPSHPLGIDIDLYGRAGAPITAARAGTVVFAGGNPCCSYGYYVEIDHGDGFHTLYAHFQAPPPVRIGQPVGQGQVIGYAGTTGYSTGVHLHFEIHKGGVPVNPLAYLP